MLPGRTSVPTVELRAGTSGAVTTEVKKLGDRSVVFIQIGPTAKLGALDLADSEKLADAVGQALEHRLPMVAVMASTGAFVPDGIAATHGWGLAARQLVHASGVVPLVIVLDGPAVSGVALLLGLADVVIMCRDAYAFVTGPRIVHSVTGVPVSSEGLGGATMHARRTGVASLVADDRETALAMVEELLSFLPDHTDDLPHRWAATDDPERALPTVAEMLPTSSTGSYDVRRIVAETVDDNYLLELREGFAPNLVTALATLDGAPVGILANQPQALAGTIDIEASQKGARFVAMCDAFNLPLLTFVDTPGFYPGKDLEWRGMIRHGAELAFAYARATVPRISVTLRKSYGGAYIVMDSKTMGSDLALAWPGAEIAVMGAKGAVEILHRRADEDERARLEIDYEARLLNPYVAADRGLIDAVIDPADTRRELCSALAVLESKRESLPPRSHDNSPL